MNPSATSTSRPRISVVIPCRNEADCIETCLRSILAQEGDGFEVILADGRSEDGTREVVTRLTRQQPRLRIIDNPGRIVSSGLNAGIRVAKGEIVVRLDAHTEYAPDYVGRCVEILQRSGADNVGGPWVAKGDGLVSRAIAAGFQSPFAVGGARGHDPAYAGSVDTVYLGCWRRSAFEKFGYFDEELVRNQDDEHNLRIIRGGGKVYQSPKIKSWYRPRGSLQALLKQYMQYGYWKVRVIQKHKLPASWRHLVPGAFVLTLLVLSLLCVLGLLYSGWSSNQWSVINNQWTRVSFVLLSTEIALYSLAVGAASVETAGRSEWKLLPVLPPVFASYHFGYGLGFLRGILDFVVLRRGGSASFTKLTRTDDGKAENRKQKAEIRTRDQGPKTTDRENAEI